MYWIRARRSLVGPHDWWRTGMRGIICDDSLGRKEGRTFESENDCCTRSKFQIRFLKMKDRFAKPSERRANIDMRFPKTISEDQSQDLEREVSKQEIKTAVWGCGTDKSPGPDGLVELVRSVTIVPSADRWNWNLESTGIFSVASARRRIDEICLPNIGEKLDG
ncbi:hypothetical protein Tco_1555410 [Tanacetum coccineum]